MRTAGANLQHSAYEILWADCQDIVAKFGCGTCERIAEKFGSITAPCVQIVFPEAIEVLLIASEAYPGTPPVALVTIAATGTEQLQLTWDVAAEASDRLRLALNQHFVPPGPFRRVYGPNNLTPCTEDSNRAKTAGWAPFFSADTLQAERLNSGLFQRSSGILSETLKLRTVFVVGLGSGGSYVATQLARVGVGRMHILDPETVETANIARTTYSVHDIGVSKVSALAKQLLNINPSIEIIQHQSELADLGHQKLQEIIAESDLILPLTDDPKAQSVLNHFSYFYRKPALFASIYRGANGGEIILSIPGETPCYQCATSQRRSVGDGVEVEVDYGTERLVGEIALGADIQHIDSATVKMALSLLLRNCNDSSLGKFVSGAISRGFTYMVMSTVPAYWFFPAIFGQTDGQYAYQSAWLSPTRNEVCSVCGEIDCRTNPSDFPLRKLGRGRSS